jgi:hypothetical protein
VAHRWESFLPPKLLERTDAVGLEAGPTPCPGSKIWPKLNSASQHEPAAGDSLDAADDRETLEPSSTSEYDGQACAECGQALQCIAGNPRPSCYDIMASRKRPKWYDDG